MTSATDRSRATSSPAGPAAPADPGAKAVLTLIAMCLGAVMTFLEITASISGLSSIQTDLHVSPANMVWIPSAYTLFVASLVLTGGTLGARYGRKALFCTGIVVLAAGSLVVAAAGSIGVVIAGQAIAGVGGALILPNSVALLGAAYPDPHRRTEAISLWAASSGIGLAAGPVIAGVLLNHFSWHAIFLTNPVFAVIALALTVPVVRELRQPNVGGLDLTGVGLATLSIAALVYTLIEGGHRGYGDPRILATTAITVLAAVLFVLAELRIDAPMLDVRLFRSVSFSSVMVVSAVSLFGFAGIALLEVLFFQRVQQQSTLDVGWRLLALILPYVVVAGLSGPLVRRTGFKAPLAGGLLIAGLAALGLLHQEQAEAGFGSIWWTLVLFGAACGLIIAPSTAAALVSVGPERVGMASGAVNTFRQIGTVLGTSILGTMLTSRVAHGFSFTSGVHAGILTVAIVFVVSAGLVLVGVHNRPHHQALTR